MWAATEGYFDIVELLLAHNADVNVKNPAGYTALMFAAESDRSQIVSLLLDSGADIGDAFWQDALRLRNSYEETVLMTMARRGQTDIVQRLVKMGAELNATNKIGDTALYLAADNGHTYTVKALIELGAEVNTANIGGWTPLMMAAARGDLETMTILLANGADFRPKNRWDATALSEARNSFRSAQAVDLLIKAGATE
uniref:Putative ankryin repeat protein n=2 Tax=Tolypothrix TaxID=111782 RepID=A5HIW2_9CYAN|nr:putative ankryin repeat protein [Fremyella diplosiphon Fd33]